MKYVCIRKNFFAGRLWVAGDTADFGLHDASTPSVRTHFRRDHAAEVEAAVSAPAGATQDPAAPEAQEDGKPQEPPAEPTVVNATEMAEDSNLRDNMKTLCLRAGIQVKPNMSIRQMRTALAAAGIVVN